MHGSKRRQEERESQQNEVKHCFVEQKREKNGRLSIGTIPNGFLWFLLLVKVFLLPN